MSLQGTATFQALPPELWDIICEYAGQASAHTLLRTCRALYWSVSPRAWRKVVLAPSPEWVLNEDRPVTDWTLSRNVGHVYKGFLRAKRLLHTLTVDLGAAEAAREEGRWHHLPACRELTFCELMDAWDFQMLFAHLPNVRKVNVYMGNFLHWYRESIGLEDTAFSIALHEPPRLPERWAGPNTAGRAWRPRMLTIDCEAHLRGDFDHTRYHFKDELYAATRLHNTNVYGWFDSFPNIRTLKCGSWFLELLWSACYLHNVTRGEWQAETDRETLQYIVDRGIGGLPKVDYWTSLQTLTIQGYEDEHPEIQYHRHRSIVPPNIWTLLGTFRSLRTIRCEVGPWKRLHRYPGGFDLLPHVESLVSLAALQICQRIHEWDVKIEDFMITLRDIELLTTLPAQDMFNIMVPPPPHLPRAEQLAKLLDFIRGIGWTGYISIPDSTNWWSGPTYRFWRQDAVVPVGNLSMGHRLTRMDPTHGDFIPWELFAGDPQDTSVNLLLEHYINAIELRQDWRRAEKGLYIYHESCWYNHYLHPRYRHMANAQYDEQLIGYLAARKGLVKGLSIATNNWTNFEASWCDLDENITAICYDAFDYRVVMIIPDHSQPNNGYNPRLNLRVYHARGDTYDFLSSLPSLRRIAIVNFQWAFDPKTAGPNTTAMVDPDAMMTQHIEDVLDDSRSLQKLILIGDVYFRIPPKIEGEKDAKWPFNQEPFTGSEEQRFAARDAVKRCFKNPDAHSHKIDLEYMRFKYIKDKDWKVMMKDGAIGEGDRARVQCETNDIPALNRYPTWQTWDEIDQWREVETKGWKLYENHEGYPVIMDEEKMYLDVKLPEASPLEEKMAAWSARLHIEKDAPWDPTLGAFVRWHRSLLSRFRRGVQDFYTVHPGGHL